MRRSDADRTTAENPAAAVRQGNDVSMPDAALTRLQLAAYGAPSLPMYLLLNPSWSILPGIYAQYFGLSLASVATAMFVARIFDALADPIIGFLSDRHRAFGGSRRAWVLLGGLAFVVSGYFLYVPSPGVSADYFLLSSIAFFLTWTIAEIPLLAWGRELAINATVRASVFGWRTGFVFAGHTLFFVLPFLPLAEAREYSPDLMRAAFFAGSALMVAALAINFLLAPDGRANPNERNGVTWKGLLEPILRNKPFLYVELFNLLACLGIGMWYALMYLFLSSYLRVGDQIAVIFLTASLCGMASIPVWLRVIGYFGIRPVLASGLILFIVALAASLALTPGIANLAPLATICTGFVALAVYNLARYALLADVADYAAVRFRTERTATYYALDTLLNKTTYAVGVSVGLGVVSLFGFKATIAEQSDRAVLGLRLAYVFAPLVLVAVSVLLLLAMPLNGRRMRTIRKRLEQQRMRADGGNRAGVDDGDVRKERGRELRAAHEK